MCPMTSRKETEGHSVFTKAVVGSPPPAQRWSWDQHQWPLCHHRLHHTEHAFAEKTKRWPSFSCQVPQGRGCLREPRQHNGDGRRRFPLSESSAVRLHTAAVRGSGPHWEAVRMLQTGAKSAAFSQHRCHERCAQAVPIWVASAAQAETWDSTEAAAEPQTATAAGQLEQPWVVAHGAALGLVPAGQLQSAGEQLPQAKTPQGFVLILPCAAWAGASSRCRLSPRIQPNHNSHTHRQVDQARWVQEYPGHVSCGWFFLDMAQLPSLQATASSTDGNSSMQPLTMPWFTPPEVPMKSREE